MTPNIALTGKLRSGKDSIADYLTSKYGYTRFAFGDELKRYANDIFDVPDGEKPRELYQWFGQTIRERDPDVWTRKCFDNIAFYERLIASGTLETQNPYAVISDVRQLNEFERCRAEGYVIIRVNASEGVRVDRAVKSSDTFNYADLRHDTESHVDTFSVDYDVYNVGALDELYAQIDWIMGAIKWKHA